MCFWAWLVLAVCLRLAGGVSGWDGGGIGGMGLGGGMVGCGGQGGTNTRQRAGEARRRAPWQYLAGWFAGWLAPYTVNGQLNGQLTVNSTVNSRSTQRSTRDFLIRFN